MPTIRQRIASLLLGDEKQALMNAANLLTEAYQVGPRVLPPELLLKQLSEYDSQLVDLLVRQIANQSGGFSYKATEQERIRMIDISRRMYDNDPVISNIINTWTDFGFGLHVDVTPRDENAALIWQEFWSAQRNNYILGQRRIAELSNKALIDGDFLLVFFISKLTGKVTVRLIPGEEIKSDEDNAGIISEQQDKSVPLWYRRVTDDLLNPVFYPDWRATEEMLAAQPAPEGIDARTLNSQTDIKAMLVCFEPRNFRGWPLLTTGFEWAKAYKTFLEDRAAVARAVTMFVDKLKVTGGQRSIDNIAAKLQSSFAAGGYSETNPRPTAGSTWLENEAATRERMPLTTGASDAAQDGSALLAMAGISARIYPHWLGRGEAFRLATATAMEMPTLRAFNRYQLFWASIWQDMSTIVLQAAEQYGSASFSTYEVDVNQDALITARVEDLKGVSEIIYNGLDRTTIDPMDAQAALDQLMRLGLQAVGVKDVDSVLGEPILQDNAELPPEDTEDTTAQELAKVDQRIKEQLARLATEA